MGRIRIYTYVAKRFVNDRVLRKSYSIAKMYYSFRFRLGEIRSREKPIIIYSMGKAGTSTIRESLKAFKLGVPVYQVHHLTEDGIKNNLRRNVTPDKPVPPEVVWIGEYLRNRILSNSSDEKWKVITLVREPIARNISAFFHSIHRQFPNFVWRFKTGNIQINDLIETFFSEYPHGMPITWFDSEMKKVFGIDVFAYEFPRAKGFNIYEGEYANLLLIKLENLSSCAQVAFKEFLNIEIFHNVRNSNVSEDKDYYIAYQKFIDTIKIPDSHINEMYETQFMQHFYSEEEIGYFKLKWRDKTT